MKRAGWTYELPATGTASEGLEDYEARSADGEHVGVVVGLVRRAEEMFVLVDAGAMPPFIHRRLAVRWEDVADVDHAALVVQLALDRAGLEKAALALDPRKAVHGPGAEVARTRLPAALTHPVAAGTEGPMERGSAILLAALAAASPFSLFVIVSLWIARGLSGWEYGLLAIPFVFAALAVALEGYRLYREPHVGHGPSSRAVVAPRRSPRRAAVQRRLGGTTALVVFALGGGVLYLATLLVVTLAWGKDLPLLGWIGFAVASTVVLAASSILAVFLVRSSRGAGSERPERRPRRTAGVHGVLVVADEGCSGAALCRPLAERLEGRPTELLIVAPALTSATHYLDSDVDAGREAAERRLAETVAAFEEVGISARGEVGSESPLEAIGDALALFAADEIVVATPPPERTNWLEEGVVDRARALYAQPISHLVVEAAAPLELRRD
jgi:hypothetical protein